MYHKDSSTLCLSFFHFHARLPSIEHFNYPKHIDSYYQSAKATTELQQTLQNVSAMTILFLSFLFQHLKACVMQALEQKEMMKAMTVSDFSYFFLSIVHYAFCTIKRRFLHIFSLGCCRTETFTSLSLKIYSILYSLTFLTQGVA